MAHWDGPTKNLGRLSSDMMQDHERPCLNTIFRPVDLHSSDVSRVLFFGVGTSSNTLITCSDDSKVKISRAGKELSSIQFSEPCTYIIKWDHKSFVTLNCKGLFTKEVEGPSHSGLCHFSVKDTSPYFEKKSSYDLSELRLEKAFAMLKLEKEDWVLLCLKNEMNVYSLSTGEKIRVFGYGGAGISKWYSTPQLSKVHPNTFYVNCDSVVRMMNFENEEIVKEFHDGKFKPPTTRTSTIFSFSTFVNRKGEEIVLFSHSCTKFYWFFNSHHEPGEDGNQIPFAKLEIEVRGDRFSSRIYSQRLCQFNRTKILILGMAGGSISIFRFSEITSNDEHDWENICFMDACEDFHCSSIFDIAAMTNTRNSLRFACVSRRGSVSCLELCGICIDDSEDEDEDLRSRIEFVWNSQEKMFFEDIKEKCFTVCISNHLKFENVPKSLFL